MKLATDKFEMPTSIFHFHPALDGITSALKQEGIPETTISSVRDAIEGNDGYTLHYMETFFLVYAWFPYVKLPNGKWWGEWTWSIVSEVPNNATRAYRFDWRKDPEHRMLAVTLSTEKIRWH